MVYAQRNEDDIRAGKKRTRKKSKRKVVGTQGGAHHCTSAFQRSATTVILVANYKLTKRFHVPAGIVVQLCMSIVPMRTACNGERVQFEFVGRVYVYAKDTRHKIKNTLIHVVMWHSTRCRTAALDAKQKLNTSPTLCADEPHISFIYIFSSFISYFLACTSLTKSAEVAARCSLVKVWRHHKSQLPSKWCRRCRT